MDFQDFSITYYLVWLKHYIRVIPTTKEFRVILLGTVLGFLAQTACTNYIRNHPEDFAEFIKNHPKKFPEYANNPNYKHFNHSKLERRDSNRPRGLILKFRGGALIEISFSLFEYLAKYGIVSGLTGTLTALLLKPGAKAVIKVGHKLADPIRKSLPQNLLNSDEHHRFTIGEQDVEGLSFSCNDGFKTVFKILLASDIPYEKKARYAFNLLNKHEIFLKMNSHNRVLFLLCLISILIYLYGTSFSGFLILLESLIEAIKTKKISKSVARMIIRRLRANGVIVPSELYEVVRD